MCAGFCGKVLFGGFFIFGSFTSRFDVVICLEFLDAENEVFFPFFFVKKEVESLVYPAKGAKVSSASREAFLIEMEKEGLLKIFSVKRVYFCVIICPCLADFS